MKTKITRSQRSGPLISKTAADPTIMNVGERVRRIYEKRPYPRVGGENPLRARWRLAPLDWIRAVWQPAPGLPRRILVAGCGTGAEAFTLARRFPEAQIVGVDFWRYWGQVYNI